MSGQLIVLEDLNLTMATCLRGREKRNRKGIRIISSAKWTCDWSNNRLLDLIRLFCSPLKWKWDWSISNRKIAHTQNYRVQKWQNHRNDTSTIFKTSTPITNYETRKIPCFTRFWKWCRTPNLITCVISLKTPEIPLFFIQLIPNLCFCDLFWSKTQNLFKLIPFFRCFVAYFR